MKQRSAERVVGGPGTSLGLGARRRAELSLVIVVCFSAEPWTDRQNGAR